MFFFKSVNYAEERAINWKDDALKAIIHVLWNKHTNVINSRKKEKKHKSINKLGEQATL